MHPTKKPPRGKEKRESQEGFRKKKTNIPNRIRTNTFPPARSPNALFAHGGARMGRIHHPPCPHEDAHVRDLVGAIAVRGPEDHVAGFGLGAREVLAEAGVVLGLGGAGDGEPFGFADGVLGEAWISMVSFFFFFSVFFLGGLDDGGGDGGGKIPEQSKPPPDGPLQPPPPQT